MRYTYVRQIANLYALTRAFSSGNFLRVSTFYHNEPTATPASPATATTHVSALATPSPLFDASTAAGVEAILDAELKACVEVDVEVGPLIDPPR